MFHTKKQYPRHLISSLSPVIPNEYEGSFFVDTGSDPSYSFGMTDNGHEITVRFEPRKREGTTRLLAIWV